MSVQTSGGVGQYFAGEGHIMWLPRAWAGSGTKRAIVFCHGSTEDYTGLLGRRSIPDAVAEAGWPVLSTQLSGTTPWTNDTAQARVTSAWTFAKTQFGAKTDKMILWGDSMGTALALMYAANNTSNVAGLVLNLAIPDVAYVHDNVAGLTAQIETAFGGGAGYTAAMPAHNPYPNFSALANVPMKLWTASDDTTATPAKAAAYAAQVSNAELQALGAVGHDPTKIVPADIVDFLTRKSL